MAMLLRQSTASQEIPIGPFKSSSDGVTSMTSLTIANTDIKLFKGGATTLANKNSGGATHISGGIYYAVLDATDTNTVGLLVIYVEVATALYVRCEFQVVEEDVYDALYASGAGASLATYTSTIASATASTVTLKSPWNTGLAVYREIFIDNQARWITGYSGSAVYTIDRDWDSTPSADTAYLLGGIKPPLPAEITAIKTKTDALPSTWPTYMSSLDIDSSGRVTVQAASVRTAVGLASANLDTQLSAIAGYIDTEVAAIKTKTDALPSTWPTNFSAMAITAGGLVGLNTAQASITVRDVSEVGDVQLTIGDCLIAALSLSAGDATVSGTTYAVKTPAGSTVAIKTLNSATAPTSKT